LLHFLVHFYSKIKMLYFTENLQQDFRRWLKTQSFSAVCVLSDSQTAVHCYPLLAQALQGQAHLHFTVPSGENAKNLPTCSLIWQYWLEQHLDRNALIINLGGGVIGDMGGFCAATYKRGICFIQMPTTLLAQVDASVGGKVGVDFEGYKNVIGAFALPTAVWIDTQFLNTLPAREIRSGMGEVIKHCLIADNEQWAKLPSLFDTAAMDWQVWVRHSIDIKQKIVSEDMYEQGIRKTLNFGHTIGHAIETFFLTQKSMPLLHGEAVAWGMLAESYLSMRYAGLSQASFAMIVAKIKAYFPENYTLSNVERDFIARLALQDKKNKQGIIQTVMLTEVGKAIFDMPITQEDIKESLLATD